MKQFRKRTIALVLASVVTVVGAFGAENYKNSLMAVDFESSANGAVNMVLQTKSPYSGTLSPIKKDANTYVLMLPEVNSLASTPDLTKASGSIESIDIKTMPYSNYGKGYLKIVVKTSTPSANLLASNKIFVADKRSETRQIRQRDSVPAGATAKPVSESVQTSAEKTNQSYKFVEEPSERTVKEVAKPADTQEQNTVSQLPISQQTEPEVSQNEAFEAFMLVMAIFLILVVAAYSYVKAKNKMREIAGENLYIDLDEDEDKAKKSKIKKIKKTIKTLDKAYPKPPSKSKSVKPLEVTAKMPVEETEDLNIVDLDELFQEHKAQKSVAVDDENDALEDFLSGFSFDDEVESESEPDGVEVSLFDEELLQKALSNEKLKFSHDDVERINKLLKMEINDDTMRNIDKFAISNPIKKIPSSKQILENLVTTYAVTQNVSFTGEDIDALYKLINVEIDSDFITDLKTNPERTAEMQLEIESAAEVPRKSREMLTLNVKDMLPDLSEALRQQGGRKIESEAKPVTIYASEGYDVNVLTLTDKLPDLSIEINNKDAYKNKPSSEIQYADNSYEVETLNIGSTLPDLRDVMANPDKYEEPEEEEVVVDEDALLNNISNVQFKPFYDGTEEFEVINDFSETDSSSFSEAQDEFNQFDNFEVVEEEVVANNEIVEQDDFQSLYSGEYFDLDKGENEGVNEEVNIIPEPVVEAPKEEFVPAKLERRREIRSVRRERGKLSEDLIQKIAASHSRKEIAAAASVEKREDVKGHKTHKKEDIKCILDGQTYSVVSTAVFEENSGCHLAKNEAGYVVLGFVGDKICKIKEFESLKSEKIQARQSDTLPDGSLRYIVRIGICKFIVDFKDNEMKYVMDLC